MPADEQDAIERQRRLLNDHRTNLYHLQTQAAAYGGEQMAPLAVINGLRAVRQEIEQAERELANLMRKQASAQNVIPPAPASHTLVPAKQSGPLSFRQKTALVDALLACDTIKDRGKRESVVKQLSVRNIPRDASDATDVFNIVNACLNHEQGIAELIDIVRFFEGQTTSMRALDARLAELGM